MKLSYPTRPVIRAWIIQTMADDPELHALADLCRVKDQRAFDRAFDAPSSVETISTPWGPMTRWFAASTMVREWRKAWPSDRSQGAR